MKHIKLFENFNQSELIPVIMDVLNTEKKYFETIFEYQFKKHNKNMDDFISWVNSSDIDFSYYEGTLEHDDILGLIEGLIGRFLYEPLLPKNLRYGQK